MGKTRKNGNSPTAEQSQELFGIYKFMKIFVSSTFRDMDLERDLIKNYVIPTLNYKYSDSNISFQTIDLRYGVNTSGLSEKEAATKVLSMCMDSIDNAQPFFICFLGDRYGWAPNEELWLDFYSRLNQHQQAILKDTKDLSVTEMEIKYALSCTQQSPRCVFCMRDEKSLETLSPELKGEFSESDEALRSKLIALKDTIANVCQSNPNFQSIQYTIDFSNPEESSRQLAEQIINAISIQVDEYIKTAIAPYQRILNELEKEQSDVLMKFQRLCVNSLYRNGEEWIEEGDVIIAGEPFSGKSTYLARQYYKLFEEDLQDDEHRKILLAASVNTSRHSRSMRDIMGRWVVELAKLMKVPLTEDLIYRFTHAAKESEHTVRQMFYVLVDGLIEHGHSVHIFLDDVDQFAQTSPGDERLDWIDERVTVYLTASSYSEAYSTICELPLTIYGVVNKIDDKNGVLLRKLEKQYLCDLPSEVEEIVKHDYNTNLLQMATLFQMKDLLNHSDFEQGRAVGDYAAEMNKRMIQFFKSLPHSYGEAFRYLADFFAKRSSKKEVFAEVFSYIQHAHLGLRDVDILNLVDNKLSAAELYGMLRCFDMFILVEKELGLIRLRHPHLKSPLYHIPTLQKLFNYVAKLPMTDWLRSAYMLDEYIDYQPAEGDPYSAYHMKAKSCMATHQYAQALPYLDRAMQLFEKDPDFDLDILCQMFEDKCIIYACMDKAINALQVYNHLIKIDYSREKNVDPAKVFTHMDKVFKSYKEEDYENALIYMLQSQPHFMESYEANVLANYVFSVLLADLYAMLDQAEEALQIRHYALELSKMLSEQFIACRAHANSHLAFALSDDSEEDAFQYAEEAVRLFEIFNPKHAKLPYLYILMANLYNDVDDVDMTDFYYAKALALVEEIDPDNHELIDDLRAALEESETPSE